MSRLVKCKNWARMGVQAVQKYPAGCHMHFELYLRNLLRDGRERFTCILGAGLHAEFSPRYNILASWRFMLSQVTGQPPAGESPALAVEHHLLAGARAGGLPDRNLAFRKEVRNHLEWETARSLRGKALGGPDFLFNPAWVSDLILLNIDQWVEGYCRTHMGAKVSGWRLPPGFEGRMGFDKESLRYRVVSFPGGGVIRIWHLHGCVARPEGMCLGLDGYQRRAGLIENLRRHRGRREGNPDDASTWYDALHGPLLILGASMPASEWELWTALSDRERSMGRRDGGTKRRPVFQMREREEGCLSEWFLPLFDEGGAYSAQWRRLEDVVARSLSRADRS
ncbi:MAG: hypothetical protein EBZ67_04725 [Chitinophagia bacterium]|nr:hypothetical protein [Chitinophagia bacterium]